MRRYQWVIRVLFAGIFIAGGSAHLVLGRINPAGYAVFGDTALLPWLTELWVSFVMPNIGWLTIALGIYEIACGAGMLWKPTVVIATWGMIAFLVFITVVGYGLPADSIGQDVLKNRLITIVMVLLLVPLLRAGRDHRRDEQGELSGS